MRRSFSAVFAVFVCLTGQALAQEAAQQAPAGYVVVLRDTVQTQGLAAQYQPDNRISAAAGNAHLDRGVVAAIQQIERRYAFRGFALFSRAIRGFAAQLTPQQVAALRNDPAIAVVEPNIPIPISAQSLPWGIDRTDADLSSTQAGNGSGDVSGVHVYVIDSGIDATHPDLNAAEHVTFTDDAPVDCLGHGTHVAGIIGARDNDSHVVGMAPGVPLHSVKIFGCSPFTLPSLIIQGVEWVTANAIKPAVVNMSIGSMIPLSSVNMAVRNSAATGIFYAIAAGNGNFAGQGIDACASSPAGAAYDFGGFPNGIMSVAATDSNEQEAAFSNFGVCVDIWAPGVNIPSTYPMSLGGLATLSGTSMATPHVAGAAALWLSRYPGTPMWYLEAALEYLADTPGTLSKDGRTIRRLAVRAY